MFDFTLPTAMQPFEGLRINIKLENCDMVCSVGKPQQTHRESIPITQKRVTRRDFCLLETHLHHGKTHRCDD